jgi:predicted dinucleotide-binding enzyme
MNATVAIIRTGKMAAGLAKRLAAAAVPVAIGSREAAKARTLAKSVGNGAQAGSIAEAGRRADIIVLAVPYTAAGETIVALGDVSGKILVDISNPVTPDYMALTLGHTSSAAEEIQKLAPMAHVVKAFNTIFSQIFDLDTKAAAARVLVFYAADDKEVASRIADFIGKMAFDAVYSGALSNARYLEPVGELNIHLGFALGHGTMVAPAWIKAA